LESNYNKQSLFLKKKMKIIKGFTRILFLLASILLCQVNGSHHLKETPSNHTLIHFIHGYEVSDCPTCPCVLESALKNLPRSVKVVIWVVKNNTDEIKSNLEHLITTEDLGRLIFKPLNLTHLTYNTPFEGYENSYYFRLSESQLYDIADVARITIIYKYGGVYCDFGTLILKADFIGIPQFLALQFPSKSVYDDQQSIINGFFGKKYFFVRFCVFFIIFFSFSLS
jgi:hypothetical protein